MSERIWRRVLAISWPDDSARSPRPQGPLAGIRVLDLTRLLPGAFATALLADLGADVLKVEQPGIGDPMRAYEPRIGSSSAYTWVADRNKRSIAVNLGDERGVGIVLALAAEADAVVEGFRPGVADRLGVGYEAVREVNRAAVYCSISGYGADGPLAREVGHDLNYVGRAGILSLTGVGGQPALPGVQIADLAGSMLGVVGLLSAIVHAQPSGEGDHVDVAMTDAAFALNALTLGAFFAEGRTPGIETELLNGGVPCYSIYECADGSHLTVGSLESPFWRALCEAVDRPDLVGTQFDPEAVPIWREVFAARPRQEWLELLAGQEACVGPVNDIAAAVADPQLRHRQMVLELEAEGVGAVPQLGTPVKLRERPGGVRHPAPELGSATEASLMALGFGADEIAALLADGVVAATGDPDRTIG